MAMLRLIVIAGIATGLVAGASTSRVEPVTVKGFTETHCIACHNPEARKGGLDLTTVAGKPVDQNPIVWEKVLRRLHLRDMPPVGKERPDDSSYRTMEDTLAKVLDARPVNPGRTETLRRMTRFEYQNAIRDLLDLNIDAVAMLPPDEAGHGFDNVNVGTFSPTQIERYLNAAQKIARLAVGGSQRTPFGETIRIKQDITQEERMEGLPFGTRGGALIPFTFPRDGDYDLQIKLSRDRNELVEGLTEPHEILVLLDGRIVKTFSIRPPGKPDHTHVDDHLTARIPVPAGPHQLGVTFRKNPSSLIETMRQPYASRFNFHRHPRVNPALYQVTITGPFADRGPGDTPSRRRIFVTRPTSGVEETAAARQILASLLRRAYRRPIVDADIDRMMPFVHEGRKGADFDAGIEAALAAILISREFLFRVETDPNEAPAGSVYRITDLELASRLSFFLWSSIPDDELLSVAERRELSQPDMLARQTKRMLADPKAQALATNFAGQWLQLRNLESITPDGRLFPDFDDNLRQAFRRETELLVQDVLSNNRSIRDLLTSKHTFVNERLARHYGMPHITGPHFRKVECTPGSERGGLLRHGSILMVSSYATRTSPVLRGKWILEILLASPPPPPPPDVPALEEQTVSAALPVRERLKQHRTNAACASCHAAIDPVGFALEHYDAIGRWRNHEEGAAIDANGRLPDGRTFHSVAGLERALADRPELLARALTEKLLTYALGRGIESSDGPAIRAIMRTSRKSDDQFQDLIVAIVMSPPFQMRISR